MIKDKRVAFAIYVVVFVAVWRVVEMLLGSLTGEASSNAGVIDISTPLIVALVTGYLFFLAKQVNINDELEEARNTDGAVIVDVREAEEFAQGHIPGAINIPVDDMELVRGIIPDRDTPLFTYCLRGSRSNRAVKYLKAMGYTHVISMGGINKYRGEIERG